MSAPVPVYRRATSDDYLQVMKRLVADGDGYYALAQDYLLWLSDREPFHDREVYTQMELEPESLRVLTLDSVLVGCVWLSDNTITHMQVHKEHRKQGFDRCLVSHAIVELNSNDCWYVLINPTELNAGEDYLWTKLGFKKQGQTLLARTLRKGLPLPRMGAPAVLKVVMAYHGLDPDSHTYRGEREVGGVVLHKVFYSHERIHLVPNLEPCLQTSLQVYIDGKLIYNGSVESSLAQRMGVVVSTTCLYFDHIGLAHLHLI